jgi:hypothetical protein
MVNIKLKRALSFYEASLFDQALDRWDVSHVTTMSRMFAFATRFNHPIGDWNVSQVTRTYGMFRFAKSFHGQDLSRWDLSWVTKRKDFMNGAGAGNILPSDWP